jgi:hypothetical protein
MYASRISHLASLISPLSSRPGCLNVTLGIIGKLLVLLARFLPLTPSLLALMQPAYLMLGRLSEHQEPNFPRRSLHLMWGFSLSTSRWSDAS